MPSISPGRGIRVVAETEIQMSGWLARMSAATEPLPTAVGPARTVSRDRWIARASASLVKLALERGDLIRAESADAPRFRDAEPLHQVACSHFAEAWNCLEQVDDAHL